jgi:WD40 repeat protein
MLCLTSRPSYRLTVVHAVHAQVRDHSQAILCLSPTAHADRLLTASKDNQLRLWDFRQLGTVQVRLAR